MSVNKSPALGWIRHQHTGLNSPPIPQTPTLLAFVSGRTCIVVSKSITMTPKIIMGADQITNHTINRHKATIQPVRLIRDIMCSRAIWPPSYSFKMQEDIVWFNERPWNTIRGYSRKMLSLVTYNADEDLVRLNETPRIKSFFSTWP